MSRSNDPTQGSARAPYTFCSEIFRDRHWADETLRCFVLMPFSERFDPLLEIIQEVLCDPRWECHRADDQWSSRLVHPSIIAGIREADFIVADITGNNANVYYEVGVAQALSKEVLLLTQDIRKTKFDLKAFHLHQYDLSSENNKRELKTKLQKASDRVERLSAPFVLEDRLQRTIRINREMESLLNGQHKGEVVIRVQAGFSSICNIGFEDAEDPAAREYGRRLEEEGALMRELVRSGAQLKAIIRPPLHLKRDKRRSRKRLEMLIEFIHSDDQRMRNCEFVMALEEGTNLLAFNHEILFEGYKTGIEGGYGSTCISTHSDWIQKRLHMFDQLFDSARDYTLHTYHQSSDCQSNWPPLRIAILKALEEIMKSWRSGSNLSKEVDAEQGSATADD